MYYETINWHAVQSGEIFSTGGTLHVMATKPVQIWTQGADGARLVGIGTEVKATTAKDLLVWVEAPRDTFVQYFATVSPIWQDTSEVFLNADRRPVEGSEFEGTLRVQRLNEMAERREKAALRIAEERVRREQRADQERMDREAEAARVAREERERLEREEREQDEQEA